MGPKIKKIIIGVVLICLAVFAALAGFYYLKVKPTLATRSTGKSSTKSSSAKSTPSKKTDKTDKPSKPTTKSTAKVAEIKKTGTASVNVPPPSNTPTVQSLVKEAEKVYSPEQKAAREGSLWFDQKASQYVVTLGALNGLTVGKSLSVYDKDQRVGTVIVDTTFDVISYVHPSEESRDSLSNGYFRVVME